MRGMGWGLKVVSKDMRGMSNDNAPKLVRAIFRYSSVVSRTSSTSTLNKRARLCVLAHMFIVIILNLSHKIRR